MENLFFGWREFKQGKRKRLDVQGFEFSVEDNLFQLHHELKNKTYQHGNYTPFYVTDPKLRHIHKATVRDRVLHQAVFRVLYPIFDKTFIFDSYSCRVNKGTHKAVNQLESFCRQLSQSNSQIGQRGDGILIGMFFDMDNNIGIFLDKKVKAYMLIHTGLPDVGSFVIFFGM